ncbi:MAG: hypothetical protein JO202_11845 [Ktedonobacteraceae bacterium]|nr:hypothetical protein [Ktedonobacteraceae bacterium]
MKENLSEVARLMEQISLEYQAAQRGLAGLAYGTAQHQFITTRMENMCNIQEELQQLVGKQEATKLAAEAIDRAEMMKGSI